MLRVNSALHCTLYRRLCTATASRRPEFALAECRELAEVLPVPLEGDTSMQPGQGHAQETVQSVGRLKHGLLVVPSSHTITGTAELMMEHSRTSVLLVQSMAPPASEGEGPTDKATGEGEAAASEAVTSEDEGSVSGADCGTELDTDMPSMLYNGQKVVGLLTERDLCFGYLERFEQHMHEQDIPCELSGGGGSIQGGTEVEAVVENGQESGDAQTNTSAAATGHTASERDDTASANAWSAGESLLSIAAVHQSLDDTVAVLRTDTLADAGRVMIDANQRHVLVNVAADADEDVAHVLTMRQLVAAYHMNNCACISESDTDSSIATSEADDGDSSVEEPMVTLAVGKARPVGDITARDMLAHKQSVRNISCIVNSRIGDDVTVGDALAAMRQHNTGVVLLVTAPSAAADGDSDPSSGQGAEVAGMFTERDFVRLVAEGGGESDGAAENDKYAVDSLLRQRLENVYTRLVVTVRIDDSLERCIEVFGQHPTVNYIPVLDVDGRALLGVLSIKDIVHLLVHHVWPARMAWAEAFAGSNSNSNNDKQ